MILYIKHMVCDRCIKAVHDTLESAGLGPVHVRLGEAEFEKNLSDEDVKKAKSVLEPLGFEFIDDRKKLLTEQIKQAIVGLVHQDSLSEAPDSSNLKMNLSDYLSEKLHYDYKYLSGLFSDLENVTIEQYYIAQKVERVKELLVYGELSLTEIAYLMDYSSVAYLSSQFRSITGFSPTEFRKIKGERRIPIDKI